MTNSGVPDSMTDMILFKKNGSIISVNNTMSNVSGCSVWGREIMGGLKRINNFNCCLIWV
jgi:hypothetical protein